MIRKLFGNDVYVQIYRNKFVLKLLSDSKVESTFRSDESFTTDRLLVGNFSAAERCLRNAIREILPNKLFTLRPGIIIHPIEMVEGGISEVEDKVFRELALGVGAYNVVVHIGSALPLESAIKLLEVNN